MMKPHDEISRGWFAVTIVLAAFELIFLYEAMLADMTGYQRVFGAFAGLALVSFGALLYAASIVFYGWS
jgi:hypothetical protein